jgi:hypothetical protein
MKTKLVELDLHPLVSVPCQFSYVSYVGSYWNEIEKNADYAKFEIFEALSFESRELYRCMSAFEAITSPNIQENDHVYNYLLAQTKKLFSLTDEEVNLAWNWNIARVMHDGFFLFFEEQQYGFLKTPNYYNSEETRLERKAFKSLLTKLRSSSLYSTKKTYADNNGLAS